MEFDYSFDTITPSLSTTLTIGGAGSLVVPNGVSASEPTGVAGSIRYDTTLAKIRFYTSAWGNIATEAFVAGAYQPLNTNLTAIATFASSGIATRTTSNTWVQRTMAVGSAKLSITNPDGSAGNPTYDVIEANLTLNNISGTLSVAKGGTNLTATGTANQILGTNAGATALEYKTLTAGTGITIVNAAGAVTISNSSRSFAQVLVSAITPATGTTTIPADNTPPLSTEGTLAWTGTITPSLSTSMIKIEVDTNAGTDTNQGIITVGLFRDGTCIAVRSSASIGSGLASSQQQATPITFNVYDSPASTSLITYTLRVGGNGGNWYFGRSAPATYNGLGAGQVSLTELRA